MYEIRKDILIEIFAELLDKIEASQWDELLAQAKRKAREMRVAEIRQMILESVRLLPGTKSKILKQFPATQKTAASLIINRLVDEGRLEVGLDWNLRLKS